MTTRRTTGNCRDRVMRRTPSNRRGRIKGGPQVTAEARAARSRAVFHYLIFLSEGRWVAVS